MRLRSGGLRKMGATLVLCALPLLVPVLSAAQATDDLQTRQARMLAFILEHGEAVLEARGVRRPVGDARPDSFLMLDAAGELTIPRGSLEYAAALLVADVHPERAAWVIDEVLATQAPPGRGKQAGAFPWQPDGEPDPAATAYVAPWLACIQREFKDKLPAETRARLQASMQPALNAVYRLKVTPAETSLFLTKTAAEAMLERELAATGKARAAADLEAWAKFAQTNGIPEARSPSYCVDAIAALNWAWLAAADDEMRADAVAGLEYLYRDMALRYHPQAGMLAGAAVRAFARDYVGGMGASRYLLYAQFGRPPLAAAPPSAMFLVGPGFVPDEKTRALAGTLDVPRTVRSRTPDCTATTYLHPQFALGTMSGPVDAGTAPVLLTYPNPEAPTAYCVVRPLPARVAALQQDGRALVNFDFDDIGFDPERVHVGMDFHLGSDTEIDHVLLNETPYTAEYAVAVPTNSAVVIDRDGVFTSITVVTSGPAVEKKADPPKKPAELEWVPLLESAGGGRKLVLRVYARHANRRELVRNNYRVAVAIEMAARDTLQTVEEFAAYIYEGRTRAKVSAKRVKVGEKVENPHSTPGHSRPVERARWVFDYLVIQELQYQSGDDLLVLTEDLEKNRVNSRTVNGTEEPWDFLYRSPALNHMPGDALSEVLRPPPPPPPPPAEETTE